MPKISYICPSRHYVRVEGEDPENEFRCPECPRPDMPGSFFPIPVPIPPFVDEIFNLLQIPTPRNKPCLR